MLTALIQQHLNISSSSVLMAIFQVNLKLCLYNSSKASAKVIELRFNVPPGIKRSFWRHFPQKITYVSAEKAKSGPVITSPGPTGHEAKKTKSQKCLNFFNSSPSEQEQ